MQPKAAPQRPFSGLGGRRLVNPSIYLPESQTPEQKQRQYIGPPAARIFLAIRVLGLPDLADFVAVPRSTPGVQQCRQLPEPIVHAALQRLHVNELDLMEHAELVHVHVQHIGRKLAVDDARTSDLQWHCHTDGNATQKGQKAVIRAFLE